MAETIVDGTQFNAANIKFTAPKANASNGKSVNILNKLTNTGLRVSTPLMLTWGASDFKDEKSGLGNGKFEMGLQFPTAEYPSEEASAFLANMRVFSCIEKIDRKLNSLAEILLMLVYKEELPSVAVAAKASAAAANAGRNVVGLRIGSAAAAVRV
jgi:hypothetical protein